MVSNAVEFNECSPIWNEDRTDLVFVTCLSKAICREVAFLLFLLTCKIIFRSRKDSIIKALKGIFTSRLLCFKVLVCLLKVWLNSTARALLVLWLISESCMSIHSCGLLSSITSNTNEASAPLPSSLLHTPNYSLPPSLTLAVLAQGLSVGVTNELIKMQQVQSEDRKERIDRDASVMEMDCDALYESQISTLIASSLSTTIVSCPLYQHQRKDIFGKTNQITFIFTGKTLYCHVVVPSRVKKSTCYLFSYYDLKAAVCFRSVSRAMVKQACVLWKSILLKAEKSIRHLKQLYSKHIQCVTVAHGGLKHLHILLLVFP